MSTLMRYYKFSMFFAIAAVVLGYVLWGPQVALIIAALGVLETSLSFDNAVVNARVLANWDEKWRQRFLVWGIFIAVFGMRVIFPIAIVSATTGINPWAVTLMAVNDPDAYARSLTAVHHEVAGFGGAFLFMVALGYFFEEKQVYWWEAIESRLTKFGQLEAFSAAVTLSIIAIVSRLFEDPTHGNQFLFAGLWGVVAFILAHSIGTMLGGDEDDDAEAGEQDNPMAPAIIKAGVAGFLYLELLDASFSFDGVIGAFVLSNQIFVIALGLGIGAFFVRSMTIHLVNAGTLSEYRFLEHGAFWAILALATIMVGSGVGLELPEWITGSFSALLILAALLHSIVVNRREAAAPTPASVSAN